MKKIYVLRHWYDNEDNSGGEVIAASDNLHTLNSIMRDSVKRSGVLDEEEIEWDEDETEFLTDDHFEAWYQDIRSQLKQYEG